MHCTQQIGGKKKNLHSEGHNNLTRFCCQDTQFQMINLFEIVSVARFQPGHHG
jgi:hypothetical protein